ncbi:Phosphatidylcholine-hydrolyzing phospholipase C [Trichophyton interdigitale]|nr:Phosphatidylcholine-hydrolyzing phospholipase C [Trichophyton interdigitale]KAG8210365.1 Phosphatidylcholine-hydrolyzing phospholipase C [Trichophyton interdigitale]
MCLDLWAVLKRRKKPSYNQERRLGYRDDQEVSTKFIFAEHCLQGNAVYLKVGVDTEIPARNLPLKLPNGLSLTYGEILGLAGDLYGTDQPISDGVTQNERHHRFLKAFDTLANDTKYAPEEAPKLLEILHDEMEEIKKAIRAGKSASEVHNRLKVDLGKSLGFATLFRPSGIPSFLGLALINFDHFGTDSETAYNTGHNAAIQYALRTDSDLAVAYAMNAFADHFLHDHFSAGHLRVPRRQLHGSTLNAADACSKLMHDEDSCIGLKVSNQNGDSWTAYGDSRLFDDVSKRHREIFIKAQQASVDEIFQAWRHKIVPPTFKAWKYAPTIESALSPHQPLAPLFVMSTGEDKKPVLLRRRNVSDRKTRDYISDWTYTGTVIKCRWSGRWNYPMTLDE